MQAFFVRMCISPWKMALHFQRPILLFRSREYIVCLTENLLSYSSSSPLCMHTHTLTHTPVKTGISLGMPCTPWTPVSTVCFGFSHSLKPQMPITRLKWFESNILPLWWLITDVLTHPKCRYTKHGKFCGAQMFYVLYWQSLHVPTHPVRLHSISCIQQKAEHL